MRLRRQRLPSANIDPSPPATDDKPPEVNTPGAIQAPDPKVSGTLDGSRPEDAKPDSRRAWAAR